METQYPRTLIRNSVANGYIVTKDTDDAHYAYAPRHVSRSPTIKLKSVRYSSRIKGTEGIPKPETPEFAHLVKWEIPTACNT